MKKVYIDCDVMLDLLMERQPYFWDAAKLFFYICERKVKAYVSPLVFANVSYFYEKKFGVKKSKAKIKDLSNLVHITDLNEKIFKQAIDCSNFNDFEDGLQYYAAKAKKLDFFLTRNIKDFRKAEGLKVCTPAEFIQFEIEGAKSLFLSQT